MMGACIIWVDMSRARLCWVLSMKGYNNVFVWVIVYSRDPFELVNGALIRKIGKSI